MLFQGQDAYIIARVIESFRSRTLYLAGLDCATVMGGAGVSSPAMGL
jgi:hypothetical protein